MLSVGETYHGHGLPGVGAGLIPLLSGLTRLAGFALGLSVPDGHSPQPCPPLEDAWPGQGSQARRLGKAEKRAKGGVARADAAPVE